MTPKITIVHNLIISDILVIIRSMEVLNCSHWVPFRLKISHRNKKRVVIHYRHLANTNTNNSDLVIWNRIALSHNHWRGMLMKKIVKELISKVRNQWQLDIQMALDSHKFRNLSNQMRFLWAFLVWNRWRRRLSRRRRGPMLR